MCNSIVPSCKYFFFFRNENTYRESFHYHLMIVPFSYIQIKLITNNKVQVGKDQEKAQSEKDSHSKNRGGKKQTNNQVLVCKTCLQSNKTDFVNMTCCNKYGKM